MQTLMCYHRLALRCHDICQFCGCSRHLKQCIALLNLAVYLTNGLGIRGKRGDRLSQQNLGQLTDLRPAESPRHCPRAAARHQKAEEGTEETQGAVQTGILVLDNDDPDGAFEHAHEACVEARRRPQHLAPRIGVHGVYGPRPGQHPANVDANQQNLACDGEEGAAQTPFGQDDASGSGAAPGQIAGYGTDGGFVSGLRDLSFDQPGSAQDDAVSPLEPSGPETSTNGCSWLISATGETEPLQHDSADVRSSGDITFSCPSEAVGGAGNFSAHSVAMDGESASQHRALLRVGQIGTPLYLAAHPGETPGTKPDKISFGAAIVEGQVMGVIRILLNPTGKACAANAVLQCLAWLMLLADGYVFDLWNGGFILMRSLVHNSAIPLDLMTFGPLSGFSQGIGQLRNLCKGNRTLVTFAVTYSTSHDLDFLIAHG